MFVDYTVNGGGNFGQDAGMGLESLMNGQVDDGPEILFEGRGSAGTRMTLWFWGTAGGALLLDGRLPGPAAPGEDGVGELDPMPVKVGNGE